MTMITATLPPSSGPSIDLMHDPLVMHEPGDIASALEPVKVGSFEVLHVPIEHLHVKPGYNPRIDTPAYRDHVRSIANSILANGYYPEKIIAIFVERVDDKDVLYVHDGHTRLAAAKLAIEEGADLATLPVLPIAPGVDEESLTISLLRSNEGRSFTIYERAMVVKRLAGFGWSTSKMAEKLGCGIDSIEDCLTIASAPHKVRDMIVRDILAPYLAVALMKQYGSKTVATLEMMWQAAQAQGRTKITPDLDPAEAKRRREVAAGTNLIKQLAAWSSEDWWKLVPKSCRCRLRTMLPSELLPATELTAEADEASVITHRSSDLPKKAGCRQTRQVSPSALYDGDIHEIRGGKTWLVMKAISVGHTTIAAIAAATNMERKDVNSFIHSLQDSGKVDCIDHDAPRGEQEFDLLVPLPERPTDLMSAPKPRARDHDTKRPQHVSITSLPAHLACVPSWCLPIKPSSRMHAR